MPSSLLLRSKEWAIGDYVLPLNLPAAGYSQFYHSQLSCHSDNSGTIARLGNFITPTETTHSASCGASHPHSCALGVLSRIAHFNVAASLRSKTCRGEDENRESRRDSTT